VSRRASLPGASELFRRTSGPGIGDPVANHARSDTSVSGPSQDSEQDAGQRRSTGRSGSGRQRHDSKITVYLSGEEVLDMEQARLTLRGTHELPVDRGRIVREAVAVLLEDFDQNGADWVLVQRWREQRTSG